MPVIISRVTRGVWQASDGESVGRSNTRAGALRQLRKLTGNHRLRADLEPPLLHRRSALFAEMIAETKPGLCPFCDQPVPRNTHGRKRILCGSRECRNAYWVAWKNS